MLGLRRIKWWRGNRPARVWKLLILLRMESWSLFRKVKKRYFINLNLQQTFLCWYWEASHCGSHKELHIVGTALSNFKCKMIAKEKWNVIKCPSVCLNGNTSSAWRRMSGKDDLLWSTTRRYMPIKHRGRQSPSMLQYFCHDIIHSTSPHSGSIGGDSKTCERTWLTPNWPLFDYESTSNLLFIKNIQHKIT